MKSYLCICLQLIREISSLKEILINILYYILKLMLERLSLMKKNHQNESIDKNFCTFLQILKKPIS